MTVNSVYMFTMTDAATIMGKGAVVFTGVLFVVESGLVLYAAAMFRKGVLT